MSGSSATPTSIVNQAVALFGNDIPPVTGTYPTFDGSVAGVNAAKLYAPCVATVARQFGWDFSRNWVELATTGNTPPLGWAYEYEYPSGAAELRQLVPPAISDPNNPLPVDWSVGNVMVSDQPTKVIWANQAGALAVITNLPPPSTWDPLFQETVVRLLASEMATAIAGKADTSRDLLEQSGGFAGVGITRPD